MLPRLIVLAAIAAVGLASPSVDAATPKHLSGLRVVRTDYVEFCNDHVASIGVADGSLHGSIGNCDPHRDVTAKQIDAHADEADMIALRKMLYNLKAAALTDRSCAGARKRAPPMVMVFSGPTTLTIQHDGRNVAMNARSPCLTTAGRDLLGLVNRTTEPLRRRGLRSRQLLPPFALKPARPQSTRSRRSRLATRTCKSGRTAGVPEQAMEAWLTIP